MKSVIKQMSAWLIRFLHVQLFVSLISLPILVYAGLPVSVVSCLGNLLFNPILTLFLLISSLVFFTQLLCIPNSWLIWLLEHITTVWINLMQQGTPAWLITFALPHIMLLIALPTAACFIILHKKMNHMTISSIALILLFLCSALYLHMHSKSQKTISTIAHLAKEITILHENNQTILIDKGVFNRQQSADSWIEYTLLTHLAKTTGSTGIDHCILLHCNARIFDAISHLCKLTHVKKIYLPYWQGDLNAAQRKAYAQMRQALEQHKVQLIRIGKKKEVIPLSESSIITITPLEKQIRKPLLSYHALEIIGTVGTNHVSISNIN